MSNFLLALALTAAVVGARLGLRRWLSRNEALARCGVWQEAASLLGLPGAGLLSGQRVELGGSIDGLTVTAREVVASPERSFTSVTIDSPSLPQRVELRREGLAGAAEKLVRGSDVATGDETFDREVLVWGYAPLLLAILDAETRFEVRRFVAAGACLLDGRLTLEVNRQLADQGEIEEFIRGLLGLAVRLVTPQDVAARLAHNSCTDPLPRVRLRNLETLAERFPARPETVAALRACLHDESDLVRLFAATRLAAEGRPALEALAARSTDESIAARALEALGTGAAFETTVATLDKALDRGQHGLALAAVAALGSCRDPRAVARLRVLLGARDESLACRAATALGTAGDPAAQPSLLAALEHDSSAVREAALVALGKVAAVSAVPPLRAALAARNLDRAFRKAALGAIAEIQARATGASPGQVALANEEAGGLTLAEPRTGALTLAAAPPPGTAVERTPGEQPAPTVPGARGSDREGA